MYPISTLNLEDLSHSATDIQQNDSCSSSFHTLILHMIFSLTLVKTYSLSTLNNIWSDSYVCSTSVFILVSSSRLLTISFPMRVYSSIIVFYPWYFQNFKHFVQSSIINVQIYQIHILASPYIMLRETMLRDNSHWFIVFESTLILCCFQFPIYFFQIIFVIIFDARNVNLWVQYASQSSNFWLWNHKFHYLITILLKSQEELLWKNEIVCC